jgi:phosphoribosylformylglycinamidine synthase
VRGIGYNLSLAYLPGYMPEFMSLRGRNALSDFRLHKLLSALKDIAPALTGLAAEYWHFVETATRLSVEEQKSHALAACVRCGESSAVSPGTPASIMNGC